MHSAISYPLLTTFTHGAFWLRAANSNHVRAALLALCFGLFWGTVAHAETQQPNFDPPPGQSPAATAENDQPRPEDLQQYVGLRLDVEESAYKDGNANFRILPLARMLYGPIFASDRAGVGAFFCDCGDWLLAASFGSGSADISRNDIQELADLDRLDFGLSANLLGFTRNRAGDFLLSVSKELGIASGGWELSLFYFYPLEFGKLRWSPTVVIKRRDHRRVNYSFGVPSQNARPGRPSYQAGDALNVFVGFEASYPINRKWYVHSSIEYKRLGAAIRRSPLTDKDGLWHSYLGIARYW